jgi:glucokinase
MERAREQETARRCRPSARSGVKGGLDLGGTKIQAVVTSGGGKSVAEAKRATPRTGGPEAVVRELAAALRDALTTADLDAASLESVGVGVPGSIDARSGRVLQVANVPGFVEPFPLASALGKELGVPVAIGNDVTVAVEAERRYGAGKSYRSFIGVYWGTGVGGGIVLDGRLLSGRGSAGEIGHVCTKPGGRRCACGLEGCVEAYAGRGALEERARALSRRRKTVLFDLMEKRGRDRLTSGVWARALDAGDKLAQDLLDRAVQALGVGIGSAVTLLDVEAVIVGGGLGVRLGEEWVERIERAARPHTFFRELPAYRLSELGDLGGAIGASLLRPG